MTSRRSRHYSALSSRKSGDLSARNRDRCLMSCAAPRNNTHRIRAEVRRVPVTNNLESLECFYFSFQGPRSDSAIQGDGEARRISGSPVPSVILICGSTGRAVSLHYCLQVARFSWETSLPTPTIVSANPVSAQSPDCRLSASNLVLLQSRIPS